MDGPFDLGETLSHFLGGGFRLSTTWSLFAISMTSPTYKIRGLRQWTTFYIMTGYEAT